MADRAFNGIVLGNVDHYQATTDGFITNIDNNAVYYQGYFYSADPGTRPHMWSGIRQSGSRGQIDISLGDDDWLGPTAAAAVVAGDKVIFVFWMGNEDRLDPTILSYPRGWFELTISGPTEYTIYPMIANTSITYTYSDDMPLRYGIIDHDYNFHYEDTLNETYVLTSFLWYNQIDQTYSYTSNTRTMSHEDTVYGEQIYPIITSIRETLTFTPEGDFIVRNLSPTTTDFTNAFDNYDRTYLIRTIEYLVDSIYYDDINSIIIKSYFIELIIRTPGILNIDVYKDRDFSLVLHTDRVDFWTFKAQIKETFASPTVLAEFDIDKDLVEETLTLSLGSSTTKNLLDDVKINTRSISTVKRLVWDLKITNPINNTYNLIEGECLLHGTVTESE